MSWQVFIVFPQTRNVEDQLHVVGYSDLPGTPAELYQDDNFAEAGRGTLDEAAVEAVKQARSLGCDQIHFV